MVAVACTGHHDAVCGCPYFWHKHGGCCMVAFAWWLYHAMVYMYWASCACSVRHRIGPGVATRFECRLLRTALVAVFYPDSPLHVSLAHPLTLHHALTLHHPLTLHHALTL